MKYSDINKEAATKSAFDKIKHIALDRVWFDDHIPCASVNITLYDGTVHENIDIAYIGSDGIAAVTYYEHPRAQLDFFNNILPQIIEMAMDAGFDYANTVKVAGQEEADELDNKSERIVLELAGINIDDLEAV